MSDAIHRPRFSEGQILAAADLERLQSYARDADARHARSAHSWGIAQGLELSGADGADGFTVSLAAGMAYDGTGRQIVVAEDAVLPPEDFAGSNVAVSNDDSARYPVFLVGRDQEEEAAAGVAAGACGEAGGGRIVETWQIEYGRPGDEQDLDAQSVPAIADGPGGAAGTTAWRILLGFVEWDGSAFTAVHADNGDGIGRRAIGLRGEQVLAADERLTLRSGPSGTAGAPALRLSRAEDDTAWVFGIQDGGGALDEVLSIAANGDLRTQGRILGAIGTGATQVESGVANDGMILPLPMGVTAAQVADGKAVVHVQLQPLLHDLPAPVVAAPGELLVGPLGADCRVDADRRLSARAQWLLLGPTNQVLWQTIPCHYLVVAVVPDE